MKKILSIVLISVLVLNLIIFGLGKVNGLYFWLVIALCALASWYVKRL